MAELISGPYWVRTNTNGEHDVCGKHANVVRSYPAQQLALATADCRRLQKKHVASWRAMSDAAPELLEALQGAIGALEADHEAGKDMGDADWEGLAYQRLQAARAAIAKATGAGA